MYTPFGKTPPPGLPPWRVMFPLTECMLCSGSRDSAGLGEPGSASPCGGPQVTCIHASVLFNYLWDEPHEKLKSPEPYPIMPAVEDPNRGRGAPFLLQRRPAEAVVHAEQKILWSFFYILVHANDDALGDSPEHSVLVGDFPDIHRCRSPAQTVIGVHPASRICINLSPCIRLASPDSSGKMISPKTF